ncbi:monocarboxylate transporter 9-like [Watersipora subatra]|uniref:monocarboxylate transporter 9-like n=1 Tax=Watersipora subatra TaxID=2589382 RepID=UPI00355B9B8A
MAEPIWYKWVILLATSVSTFASYGYITGSSSIGTVYYIQIYNERIVSSMVGPIQTSMHKISCLPSFYLHKKLGSKWLQLLGGTFLSGGIALTAVTSSSWQALLLTGIVSGSGSGMVHVATTNIIKEHFPGKQIGPFGATCLSLFLATIVAPQLWRYLMTALTWQLALVTIGCMLTVNIACGLTYVKRHKDFLRVDQQREDKKLQLFPKRASSSIYIPDSYELVNRTNMDIRLSQRSLTGEDVGSKDKTKFSEEELSDLDENSEEAKDGTMLQTLRRPESIALLVVSGLYSGGVDSCFTVLGDYAERTLGLTNDQIANALSVQGITQIISAVVYLLLTACTEFSAVLLQTVSIFVLAISIFTLTFIKSEVQLYVIIGIIGFFKAFTTGNAVPLTLELSSPQRMMRLYVVKCLIDGLGVAGVPFLAVYIQETVNEKAALYLGSAALLTSASVLTPFLKKVLQKPRRKWNNEVTQDSIGITSFVSY